MICGLSVLDFPYGDIGMPANFIQQQVHMLLVLEAEGFFISVVIPDNKIGERTENAAVKVAL